MIRSLVIGAMLAAALAAPEAIAQSRIASRTIPVTGNAPNVCAIQTPRIAAGKQINFRGLNGSTLQVDTLVDAATLATRAASVDVLFDAACNFPHVVRVEAQYNGLWRNSELTPAPSGFASAIPYTATFRWGAQSATLNADAQIRRVHEQVLTVAEPTAGELTLRLEIQPGASNVQSNAPVLAGNYADTLRVTLEPQQ